MEFGKVGLVLSGGGTKGIAHAGVLKFLAEKKLILMFFRAAAQVPL
ncbi:hypothetical protein OVA09_16375 [Chryseobacterium sp. SL1]|nr:patatin-like phospholipase family protein [Chryseobacterium sp. SL1]MCY1662422.1 hypothetical protein [Chryseobacterium sp. SL1]